MPQGKRAGERCVQLTVDNHCKLFGLPERPDFCAAFNAAVDTCGHSREQALSIITGLEQQTDP